MKRIYDSIAQPVFLTLLAVISLCTASWAGPPPPPNLQSIPATPVGNAEVSAFTIAAVAAYGLWKSRK